MCYWWVIVTWKAADYWRSLDLRLFKNKRESHQRFQAMKAAISLLPFPPSWLGLHTLSSQLDTGRTFRRSWNPRWLSSGWRWRWKDSANYGGSSSSSFIPCYCGIASSLGQDSSDLLRAIASSRSSCSCWVRRATRSLSSLSLSRFAHSIMSSSVGYCSTHTYTHTP